MEQRGENNLLKPICILRANIIDPLRSDLRAGNIIIDGGKITSVGDVPPPEGSTIIDASHFLVTPAFIDLHTHLREPGRTDEEDIRSGSRAAVAGGFSTILAMPNTSPVCDSETGVEYVLKRAAEVSQINILPVGAITENLEGKKLVNAAAMQRAGAIALSDDGKSPQDDKLMKKAVRAAKKAGLFIIDHPEDTSLSGDGVIHEGRWSKMYSFPGISSDSEVAMIERDIRVAEEEKAHIHIAHVSTKRGVELIRAAKRRGVLVTSEVTPHHLLLTEDAVSVYGPNAKVKPPLRTEEDRLALLEGLLDGTIDAIATDHAPHSQEEKIEVRSAAFGVIGMETAFPVLMRLVDEGVLGLDRLIYLLTAGPAKVLSLQTGDKWKQLLGRLGKILEGEVAELTILDLNERFRISSRLFRSKSRNTPFEGWEVRGRVKYVISNGRILIP